MLLAMLQLCVSVNEAAHQPVQITAASDSRSLGCLSPVHGGWSVDGLAGMTEGWCLCHRFNLMNNWGALQGEADGVGDPLQHRGAHEVLGPNQHLAPGRQARGGPAAGMYSSMPPLGPLCRSGIFTSCLELSLTMRFSMGRTGASPTSCPRTPGAWWACCRHAFFHAPSAYHAFSWCLS